MSITLDHDTSSLDATPTPGLIALLREDVACVFLRDPAARERFVQAAFSGIYLRSRRIAAPVYLALCGVRGAVDIGAAGQVQPGCASSSFHAQCVR